MTEADTEILNNIFGEDSVGDTPAERAKTSRRIFVRSQVQVAFDNESAQGRRLTAQEAHDTFGWEILSRLSYMEAVPFICDNGEPAKTIKGRRIDLGLEQDYIAQIAHLGKDKYVQFEEEQTTLPIRVLERIARFLALDDTKLGVEAGAFGDRSLGVRLREMAGAASRDTSYFPPTLVTNLGEAAWVIKKQMEYHKTLQPDFAGFRKQGFLPDNRYHYPTYEIGRELALSTRNRLGISSTAPIHSLKEIIENRLGIPVIQVQMRSAFAGATIANGNNRGIAVNLQNDGNVWVRRNTLAHELCHLLYDPEEKLDRLRVDNSDDLNSNPYSGSERRDPVEIRANAFAAEFLAPQKAVKTVFGEKRDNAGGIAAVMTMFGISYTAAKWQIANATKIPFADMARAPVDVVPSADWIAAENTTADYFPIGSAPISRRGKFAYFVIGLLDERRITLDSAASLLSCDPNDIRNAIDDVKSLY